MEQSPLDADLRRMDFVLFIRQTAQLTINMARTTDLGTCGQHGKQVSATLCRRRTTWRDAPRSGCRYDEPVGVAAHDAAATAGNSRRVPETVTMEQQNIVSCAAGGWLAAAQHDAVAQEHRLHCACGWRL